MRYVGINKGKLAFRDLAIFQEDLEVACTFNYFETSEGKGPVTV